MSEKKENLLDLQRKLMDSDISDVVAYDFIEKTKKRLYLLSFALDAKGKNIVSHIKGTIVFVDSKFPGKVEVGDTWICTADLADSNVYYAMPIYKVTVSLLMNMDEGLRYEMIDALYKRNKKMFEAEFAERYKEEVHDSAVLDARSEYDGIIAQLQAQVSELDLQLKQNRILSQSVMAAPRPEPEMIELGSDVDDIAPIELGSEDDNVEPIELGSDVGSEPAEQRNPISTAPHTIPSMYRNSTPGIPEIRTPEKAASASAIVYNVERLDENTLYSESFTDQKYFIHISPDRNLLVVRPNSFGSVFCINNKVKLKGLGKLSEFTGHKRLVAEYSDRYEGMIIYL